MQRVEIIAAKHNTSVTLEMYFPGHFTAEQIKEKVDMIVDESFTRIAYRLIVHGQNTALVTLVQA